MESKSHETPSPSVSSGFLPLGRRGSRASMATTHTDRENINAALDQIHTAACQSDSLTLFNEFTTPPAPASAIDEKGLSEELQGGLSGLYSRFRTSVGGIVSGGTRSADRSAAETPAVKSPILESSMVKSVSDIATGSGDHQSSHANSLQGSRLHSPVATHFQISQEAAPQLNAGKSSKISSQSASVSSKTSISPSPGTKANIGPLTKSTGNSTAADPAITQLHANARRSRSSSVNISQQGLKNAESASIASGDGSMEPPLSQSSSVLSQNISHSPVLSIKTHGGIHDESNVPESSGPFTPTSNVSDVPSRKLVPADQPRPAESSSQVIAPRSSKHAEPIQDAVSQAQDSSSASRMSFGYDDSNAGSASDSITSMTHEGTEGSQLANPSTATKSGEKSKPPPTNNRLPGYGLSRASTSETTTTISSLPPLNTNVGRVTSQASRDRRDAWPRDGMLSQLGSRLLSRDFWMRDENAKDCFHCGEPFTTFRRKHHCRTCGQIFDSKCTHLIPGTRFGQPGSIRVCKPCEAMINGHDDDSSEFSDSEQSPIMMNPRVSELNWGGNSARPPADDDDTASVISQSIDHVLRTPTMAIPATRRAGEGRSAVLEINPDRPLARPTSSRSLRSSLGGRPHSMGHKRHHSRQQYIRSFKSYHDDRAPFQRRHADDFSTESRLPAFHKDNIIDPALAQYLSDDASSGDEQPSLLAAVSESQFSKSGGDSERIPFGGLLAAMKKGRSAFGDRTVPSINHPSRDADEVSLSSSRAVNLPRSSRRRNLSVTSSVHRQSPRTSKDTFLHDLPVAGTPYPAAPNQTGFKQTKSSSMRGVEAPPVELNKASLEHVRRLLQQLLAMSSVPNADSWENALMPILLKAADEVDPDVQRGDDMDIRHYVKLKKIPGGRPGDTSYVSGLVFTKNLALKSMPRSILRPNILIITFPLEYARQQHHFMSLEPVIRQEREFLENLVSRIAALRPNLLLVEKNVSGLALGLLEQAGIAVAYKVKASVLEAVSRCTQTRIVTSMDKLLTTALHSDCISFDVKTYVYSGRKKTYMYISGCPKELGCTIVLRGGNEEVLAKVKEITEFMVYVVYNLRLETCVMRDEFAKLPTSSIDDVKQLENEGVDQSNCHVATSGGNSSLTESGLLPTMVEKSTEDLEGKAPATTDAIDVPDDVPMPTYFDDMIHDHNTKILSASPFVKFETPYLLMRTREMERRLAYLKRLRDQVGHSEQGAEETAAKPQKFILITPEMVHESPNDAPPQVKEVLRAAHDAEYDRVLYHYQTQKRQWEAYVSGCSSMFDPYAHQNIVVLYSLVCTTTSIPCSGPDTFALEFYNEHGDEGIFEPDCTIGQYVEELCHTANAVCVANGCEKRMFEHHRQYVHGDAQISVLVQPYPSKLRGMQDTVLMWSCCKICGHETQVTQMSENTWKYSFGKYLEVSFWGRNLHARAGACPHDLQRDHLRYFGFKDLALRIQYDTIHLLEVIVPRPRVTWKVDNDLKLRNEVYLRTERRISKFMLSVHARLKGINVESVVPELLDECKKEIDRLVKKANEHQAALIRLLQDKYSGSRYWEIIPLNEVLRSVQEKVVEWDTTFAEFEQSFFPSEKDIKRLATLQLKKIFLDKDATSVAPDYALHASTDLEDENIQENEKPRMRRRMTLSPEKAQDVLVSVVEEHAGKKHREDATEDVELPPLPAATSDEAAFLGADAVDGNGSSPQDEAVSKEEVRHLDLAVPSGQSGRSPPDLNLAFGHSLTRSDTIDILPVANDGEGSLDASPPPLSPKSTQPSHESSKFKDCVVPRSPSTPPNRPSAIPRLTEGAFRRAGKARSPPLTRAQSQPAHLLRDKSIGGSSSGGFKTNSSSTSVDIRSDTNKTAEKKFTERLGLTALKNGRFTPGHSLIPRSTPKGRNNSRVSNLARHFEQLSREFEKERQKERRQRAALSTQSRAFPLASSKPIVEVYRNVREAVEEREPPVDGEESPPSVPQLPMEESSRMSEGFADQITPEEPSPEADPHKTPPDSFESGGIFRSDSQLMSETELEESPSDEERATAEDLHPVDSHEDTKMLPEDDSMDFKDLAKHERTTLLKMLTNFWSERSASGWAALDYPLSVLDHVFADCDIIVREDEPSSLVAFALDSSDYKEKLATIQKRYEMEESVPEAEDDPEVAREARVEHALLRPTGTHLKYQFQEGQAKMLCKVFYAEQFDALRKKCGVADRIVESLSRCAKWDSKGGKTKSLFLKTLDDRFILKSLSPVETQAFLKFAPAYFQIMSEALFHELPSAIAKMFGFYQVIIKNPATGIEFNWFLLLMENLFYDRKPNRIFDLKGSMRNRKVESTGERDEVLLDENMVDFIYETPLFSREHSKKLLSQSVWNDTLFLGRQDVMDYSLMIAIDDKRSELVVGIIDCIRTYTWDKKLESWIKDRGFAGGGRNRPTVTSPREYKSRFREAMARYVLQAPSCWHQFQPSAIYRHPHPQGEVSNATELDMDENAEVSV
ncbi:hypothetical protein N7520_005014 [Penicillium odoratum]|uniref:uncharacterized protein n=1 Tax=Penicillium odoratum TaxID=1167516 RepID=UPI002548205D|nr:uncharacterized protein N7520_005014 [Penicillium odoratum]KAJ5765455.1 hypothetical protein N7520_005014 [Penicillium odoratum]